MHINTPKNSHQNGISRHFSSYTVYFFVKLGPSLLHLGPPDIVGVDLVVDVLAVVHVKACVEEGAIAQVLVGVRLQDLSEVELLAVPPARVGSHALALRAGGQFNMHNS